MKNTELMTILAAGDDLAQAALDYIYELTYKIEDLEARIEELEWASENDRPLVCSFVDF